MRSSEKTEFGQRLLIADGPAIEGTPRRAARAVTREGAIQTVVPSSEQHARSIPEPFIKAVGSRRNRLVQPRPASS